MHLPCNMNVEMVSQQINFIKEGGGIRNSNSLERRWRRAHRRNASGIEEALNEDDDVGLLRGKIKREELKEVLFEYMGVN